MIKTELTEREKVLLNTRKRALSKLSKSTPYECGCLKNINVKHHAKTLCPPYGKVHITIKISDKVDVQ